MVGFHLCWFYETEEQYRTVIKNFFAEGIKNDEKLIYIYDKHTPALIKACLNELSPEMSSSLKKGQLAILPTKEVYMKKGLFKQEVIFLLLKKEVQNAVDEGFSGLRITGEMSWAFRGIPGSTQLIEYESNLNTVLPNMKCFALCQYDLKDITPEVILYILTTHPIVILRTEVFENFYYIPPSQFSDVNSTAMIFQYWLKNLTVLNELFKSKEQLMKQVKEQDDDLKKLNEEKGQLIDKLAHEIHTPLTSIQGFAELLTENKLNLSSSQLEYYQIIKNTAIQLTKTCTDILTQKKIESSNKNSNKNNLNL